MGPNIRTTQKNLWVAASDGDLQRVQYLIEQEGMSPNAPDPYTYTPMHAAASYGHVQVLEYLLSRGGDVNVADEDGDTPIYTAETLEVAKWLVEHGATIERVNSEGISPAQHLEEDFPAISRYLLIASGKTVEPVPRENEESGPSEYTQQQLTEALTDRMMTSVEEIMARAERDGHDPEDELTALVQRTVLESLNAGIGLVEEAKEGDLSMARNDSHETKKRKTDGE